MKNLLHFPISHMRIVRSLVRKAVKNETFDKDLAIHFYKEALKLLIDQSKAQNQSIESLLKLNDKLALRLHLTNEK